MYCLLRSSFVFQFQRFEAISFLRIRAFGSLIFLWISLYCEFACGIVITAKSDRGVRFGFSFATEKMRICYGAKSYTSAITTVNRKNMQELQGHIRRNPFN